MVSKTGARGTFYSSDRCQRHHFSLCLRGAVLMGCRGVMRDIVCSCRGVWRYAPTRCICVVPHRWRTLM